VGLEHAEAVGVDRQWHLVVASQLGVEVGASDAEADRWQRSHHDAECEHRYEQ